MAAMTGLSFCLSLTLAACWLICCNGFSLNVDGRTVYMSESTVVKNEVATECRGQNLEEYVISTNQDFRDLQDELHVNTYYDLLFWIEVNQVPTGTSEIKYYWADEEILKENWLHDTSTNYRDPNQLGGGCQYDPYCCIRLSTRWGIGKSYEKASYSGKHELTDYSCTRESFRYFCIGPKPPTTTEATTTKPTTTEATTTKSTTTEPTTTKPTTTEPTTTKPTTTEATTKPTTTEATTTKPTTAEPTTTKPTTTEPTTTKPTTTEATTTKPTTTAPTTTKPTTTEPTTTKPTTTEPTTTKPTTTAPTTTKPTTTAPTTTKPTTTALTTTTKHTTTAPTTTKPTTTAPTTTKPTTTVPTTTKPTTTELTTTKPTTTELTTTTPGQDLDLCTCSNIALTNVSVTDIEKVIQDTREYMSIHVPSLSATVRKLNSAEDNRPTSVAMGLSAIVFLAVAYGFLLMADLIGIGAQIHERCKRRR